MAQGPAPQKFGDQCTADHLFARKADMGDDPDVFDLPYAERSVDADPDGEPEIWELSQARTAVVMHDRATDWTECFPKGSKSAEDTLTAFRARQGPSDKATSLRTDNAPELTASAREMGWFSPTSTHGCPKANG